jgi:hypothetical protein
MNDSLRALLDDPTPETWADARDIPIRPGLTLIMAVTAVEPRLTAEPETYVPDAVTVASGGKREERRRLQGRSRWRPLAPLRGLRRPRDLLGLGPKWYCGHDEDHDFGYCKECRQAMTTLRDGTPEGDENLRGYFRAMRLKRDA